MMQFAFSSFLSLAIVSMMFATTVTAAEVYAPQYIFNNGTMTSTRSCSSTEWKRVVSAMVNASNARRRMGESRFLTDPCKSCGSVQACARIGYGCPNNRRRQLQATTTTQCDAKFTAIDAALRSVSVSQSCRNLIDPSLTTKSCQVLTTDCYINKVSLWNATTDTVISDGINATETTVCRYDRVTFQAHTNFDVGDVNFLVYGPGGYQANRTENMSPYYMHGNNGTNVDGTKFPRGLYNMTITTEFNTVQKFFTFRSIDCP